MKENRRYFALILCAFFGVALIVLGVMEWVDSYWYGMGTALVMVSVVRMVRLRKYCKDEAYREQVETEVSDERNSFIRVRAWAWASYLFIVIAGIASIALRALGQELLSLAAGFAGCLMLILYAAALLILRRKY